MTTDLVHGAELDDTYRLAKGLALSGMFPDAKNAEQALAKILIGRDLGLSPTQALMGIHIVEGKPMVAAVTLAAFVKQSERYDYTVKQLNDERCILEFWSLSHEQQTGEESVGISEFTIEDAKKAGLVKEKSGWAKYPRNMLFARAMSNGIRWYCPDATQGVAVYHDGEIEARVSRDGLPAGAYEAAQDVTEVSTDWITDLPRDLSECLTTVLQEASQVRPGQLSPAVVEMSCRDQPREVIEAFIKQVEADNTAAIPEYIAGTAVPDESDLPWAEAQGDTGEPDPAEFGDATPQDVLDV